LAVLPALNKISSSTRIVMMEYCTTITVPGRETGQSVTDRLVQRCSQGQRPRINFYDLLKCLMHSLNDS